MTRSDPRRFSEQRTGRSRVQLISENMNLIQPRPCHLSSPTAAVALVATLDEADAVGGGSLRALPDEVSWMQVRADLVGDIPPESAPARIRRQAPLHAGSRHGDGAGNGDGLNRSRRLIAAAAEGYDLIELDGERDIDADVLEAIPPERRLISWRGAAASAAKLTSQFRRLSSIAARSYLLVVDTRCAADGLAPLLFLRSTGAAT